MLRLTVGIHLVVSFAKYRAGSGLIFPTRFGFQALNFDPVRFGQNMSLFGSPSGQNYFFSGQFRVQSLKGDLIFLN